MTIEKGKVLFASKTEAAIYLGAALAVGFLLHDLFFNVSKASN